MEYVLVIPMDIIIKIDINKDKLEEIIDSIIASLEKNPDMKGRPIRAILEIPNTLSIKGIESNEFLVCRMSWYIRLWIMIPAHRNMVDLNIAWIIKWKKAMLIALIEIANIIMAICLKVDSAMIFFISISQLADILA